MMGDNKVITAGFFPRGLLLENRIFYKCLPVVKYGFIERIGFGTELTWSDSQGKNVMKKCDRE